MTMEVVRTVIANPTLYQAVQGGIFLNPRGKGECLRNGLILWSRRTEANANAAIITAIVLIIVVAVATCGQFFKARLGFVVMTWSP